MPTDKQITQLNANTTPAAADLLAIVDDPGGVPVTEKITLANLLKVINGLTAETAPAANDELALYDISATAADKITISDLIGTGWILDNNTWTYASATTFTVSGNVTSQFGKGTKLKLTQTTVKYFYVIASSYSAPNTTVTVTGGSDYSLANATITLPHYSYATSPQAFPHWFNYVPTWGATGAMTYTTVTTSFAKFCVIGKTVLITVRSSDGTTGGTASNTLTCTLPIEAALSSSFPAGAGYVGDTATIAGIILLSAGTPDFISARKYDGTNFGLGANRTMGAVASYEME